MGFFPKHCIPFLILLGSFAFADPCSVEDLHAKVPAPISRAEIAGRQILSRAGITVGPGPSDDIEVLNPVFWKEVLRDSGLRFPETYLEGMWRSNAADKLVAKLYLAQQRDGLFKTFLPMWQVPGLAIESMGIQLKRYFRSRFTNRQTRDLAKEVNEEHYDAGNAHYLKMLGPTMTYTSGMWAPDFTLEDAQNAKNTMIARKTLAKPGDTVLEIGCGFGETALRTADELGVKVVGVTNSIEHFRVATERTAHNPNVTIVFSDYRDIPYRFAPNTFDAAYSVEMIEAVGWKNIGTFFKAVAAPLKDGGRVVIQHIANNHDVYDNNAYFDKYIFPNGQALSTKQVDRGAAKYFGPAVDRQKITHDYDLTLMSWYENIKGTLSEKEQRKWDIYLLSVAGGFRAEEVQLYQSVYIKGTAPKKYEPIRELPSHEKLISLRRTEAEKEKMAEVIDALEVQKKDLEASLKPRPRGPKVPLAKDARIAVIGAGVSGLTTARKLKDLGYTNVVIFEKNSEAGGKSHTVNINGKPEDMGATMLLDYKYRVPLKFVKQYGLKLVRFPNEVDYSTETGGPVAVSMHDFWKKKIQGLIYLIKYQKITGYSKSGLRVPSEKLADPFTVVMAREGLKFFEEAIKNYTTGFGYGGPETPAAYIMNMFDPNAIFGAAISSPTMLEDGTQPLWKAVASELNVRYGTEVEKIADDGKGVNIWVKGATSPEHFDVEIYTGDFKAAEQIHNTTPEEKTLIAMVKTMDYSTFAVEVENGPSEGKAEVGYLRKNMTLEREGYPMAWNKRRKESKTYVFHLFAPPWLSDEQIMQNISEEMKALGATKLKLLDSRRWNFFPHVSTESIRFGHFFERFQNIQGRNRRFYAGEPLSMSTMADVSAFAEEVVKMVVSGEYLP